MNNTCIDCQKPFNTGNDNKYCRSCSRKGNRNPNWRGGVKEYVCSTCNKSFVCDTHVTRLRKYCSIKCSKKESLNPNWKGDNVGYAGIHCWIERQLIRPKDCSCCGKEGKVDAANISGEYKRDTSDWEWLCRKCHMKKDGRLNKLIERNKMYPLIKEKNKLPDVIRQEIGE